MGVWFLQSSLDCGHKSSPPLSSTGMLLPGVKGQTYWYLDHCSELRKRPRIWARTDTPMSKKNDAGAQSCGFLNLLLPVACFTSSLPVRMRSQSIADLCRPPSELIGSENTYGRRSRSRMGSRLPKYHHVKRITARWSMPSAKVRRWSELRAKLNRPKTGPAEYGAVGTPAVELPIHR